MRSDIMRSDIMKTNKDQLAENSDMSEDTSPQSEARRAFLKTSAYAAYTTPAILSLVVSENAAATSHFNCPPQSQNPNCR